MDPRRDRVFREPAGLNREARLQGAHSIELNCGSRMRAATYEAGGGQTIRTGMRLRRSNRIRSPRIGHQS